MDRNPEIIYNLTELETTTHRLFHRFAHKKIWTFSGEVGAGKTTFIKSLCKEFLVEDNVQSPTYSIVNEYHGFVENAVVTIYHIDLYRISSIEEALQIGIEDYIYSENHVFIEWPQIIEPILPQEILKLIFKIVDQTSRKVLIL